MDAGDVWTLVAALIAAFASVASVIVTAALARRGEKNMQRRHEEQLALSPVARLTVQGDSASIPVERRGQGRHQVQKASHIQTGVKLFNPGSQIPAIVSRVEVRMDWASGHWEQDVSSTVPHKEGRIVVEPRETVNAKIGVMPDVESRRALAELPSAKSVHLFRTAVLNDGRRLDAPPQDISSIVHHTTWLWPDEVPT